MPEINDEYWMRQALNLAAKGEGAVEPNPMVGCVLVRDNQLIGAGFHHAYGGPHAEVEALRNAKENNETPEDAIAYVTLEPCSHFGKTPPCANALIEAKVSRVVVAVPDPFPEVSGAGIQRLRDHGIQVDVGVLSESGEYLLAPYLKRVTKKLPWIIAKWAMTLDGKISTGTGDSKWISGEGARAWVHKLRGRMDGILVGSKTALADNPLLTVRPPGSRIPLRVVLDRQLQLPLTSNLVVTAKEVPVCVAIGPDVDQSKVDLYQKAGVQVWQPATDKEFCYEAWLKDFLHFLAGQGVTNLLVEGGSAVFGNLFDQGLVDEVAVFVAPKLVGGSGGSPVAGTGVTLMKDSLNLVQSSHQVFGNDVLISGRLHKDFSLNQ